MVEAETLINNNNQRMNDKYDFKLEFQQLKAYFNLKKR